MGRTNDGTDTDLLTPSEAADRIIGQLTALARDLRVAGADVSANAAIDAARGLSLVGISDRDRVRAALRATLLTREEDIETFERLFPTFWERLTEEVDTSGDLVQMGFVPDGPPPEQEDLGNEGDRSPNLGDRDKDTVRKEGSDDSTQSVNETAAVAPAPAYGEEDEETTDDEDPGASAETAKYSPVGQPERIQISQFNQFDDIDTAITDLTRAIGTLKDRRWESSPTGDRIDARRALRRSFGTGGSIADIPFRSHRESAINSVVLVDVSQSVLDTLDRELLLHFLHRLATEWRDVRIFFFDTDVQEVSDSFAQPTPEHAALALQRAESKWGGGTRIAHALNRIRREHPYAIDRETTVFVISDGLEADEIAKLQSEMAMMSRQSDAIYWLNPIATSPKYEPTCRGMAASLPYIDALFAFSEPKDIIDMARQIQIRGAGGNIGYQYDHRDRAI